MSAFHQSTPSWMCPRCTAVLAPGVAHCDRCGWQLAAVLPKSTAAPARSSLSSPTGKGRAGRQDRAALLYFLSVFLVIAVFAFLLLHAAGLSLSTLFSAATSTPAPLSSAVPKGAPLFSDNFLSDASGWNLQSAPGKYAVRVGDGAMTLEIDKHNLLWELVPGERSYSDFLLTVNAVLSQGDQNNGYGVYIRGASTQATDLATYYRFEVYGDGSYAIFKGTRDAGGNATTTKLVDYTLSAAIHKQGQLNHIMIMARGAALSLIVNGQLLKAISDQSYTNGSVALFVSNLPQAKPDAQAQFSQFAIYPVHA